MLNYLSPLRLPISPPGLQSGLYIIQQSETAKYLTTSLAPNGSNYVLFGGGTRSRTEIHGFAIRCIAILPFRLFKLLLVPAQLLSVHIFLHGILTAVKTKKPC